jgi:hypothetical protein
MPARELRPARARPWDSRDGERLAADTRGRAGILGSPCGGLAGSDLLPKAPKRERGFVFSHH